MDIIWIHIFENYFFLLVYTGLHWLSELAVAKMIIPFIINKIDMIIKMLVISV